MTNIQYGSGALDPSFAGDGLLPFEIEGLDHAFSRAVVTGRDGVLYVAGQGWNMTQGIERYWIAAFEPLGQGVAEFGEQGCVVGHFCPLQGGDAEVHSRVYGLHYRRGDDGLHSDRLLLLGTCRLMVDSQRRSYTAVACLKVNGQLDAGFGENGVVLFTGADGAAQWRSSPCAGRLGGRPLAREVPGAGGISWAIHDERMYIAGQSADRRRLLCICIHTGGAIDWQFGSQGVATIEHPSAALTTHGLYADESGVYLGGRAAGDGLMSAMVARLRHDGVLDQTFAGNGIKVFDEWSGGVSILALQQTSAQGMVAVGPSSEDGEPRLTMMGFDHQGEPDPAFNQGRPVLLDIAAPGYWLAIERDGDTLVVAGSYTRYRDGGPRRYLGVVVARYWLDGRLDPDFAGGVGWRCLEELDVETDLHGLCVRTEQGLLLVGAQSDRDNVLLSAQAFVAALQG